MILVSPSIYTKQQMLWLVSPVLEYEILHLFGLRSLFWEQDFTQDLEHFHGIHQPDEFPWRSAVCHSIAEEGSHSYG